MRSEATDRMMRKAQDRMMRDSAGSPEARGAVSY